jgi:hypothetical protein
VNLVTAYPTSRNLHSAHSPKFKRFPTVSFDGDGDTLSGTEDRIAIAYSCSTHDVLSELLSGTMNYAGTDLKVLQWPIVEYRASMMPIAPIIGLSA